MMKTKAFSMKIFSKGFSFSILGIKILRKYGIFSIYLSSDC